MKTLQLPGDETIPVLGLGTWRMGESQRRHTTEVAALRQAIELGYRLIDTAEMYGEGGAESMLGQALRDAITAGDVRRDEMFVISKVYPHNAGRDAAVAACERSLKRLGLDTIDLYLLHWRGPHPLAETVDAFETLKADGRIRHWGVSNFDIDDMQQLWGVDGGTLCAANQLWYSVSRRGVEFELLPWMRQRAVPLIAYSPIDQAALAKHAVLEALGRCLRLSAAQVALAWVLRESGVTAIPKATSGAHLRENYAAAAIDLDADALSVIDTAFPPPKRKATLAVG